jgi:hypothetical protein
MYNTVFQTVGFKGESHAPSFINIIIIIIMSNRLCDIVVRGPDSIPGATRFSEK